MADGWRAYVDVDVDDRDEVEVDFARDGERWDFEVEIDDGRLELEIDYRVVGPLP
ncbi:hypothetical protein [Egicoccus halophilus]|uniref:hypothetical protein n=1 Tax=Egicoccus halophilus TaxID=1670830 RepID=UPI0013EEE672|nr:hypothetical protein [Egicoccus halophilus]